MSKKNVKKEMNSIVGIWVLAKDPGTLTAAEMLQADRLLRTLRRDAQRSSHMTRCLLADAMSVLMEHLQHKVGEDQLFDQALVWRTRRRIDGPKHPLP